MKFKLGFIVLGLGLLSGCATVAGPQNSITQQADQKELNIAFNTAKDGTPKTWIAESEDTHYNLLTSGTHVNYQGVPCRNFELSITKSFYRGETLTGTACRYNDKWTDISNNV